MQTRSLQQESLHLDAGRRTADVDSRAIQRVGTQLQHFAADAQRLRAGRSGCLTKLHVTDNRRLTHLGSWLGHQQTQPDPISVEFQLLVTVFVRRHFQRQAWRSRLRSGLARPRTRHTRTRNTGIGHTQIRQTGIRRSGHGVGRRIRLVEPDFQPRRVPAKLRGVGVDIPLGQHLDRSHFPLHTRRWRRRRSRIASGEFRLRGRQIDLPTRRFRSRAKGGRGGRDQSFDRHFGQPHIQFIGREFTGPFPTEIGPLHH